MKILMLLPSFFPPDIRVEKEARTLLKAGHEVFLLCRSKEGMPREELVQGIKVVRAVLPKYSSQWIRNFLWFRIFTIYPFWRESLAYIVEQEAIESLHVHDLPLVKTGLDVACRFNIPLVADLHENYPEAIGVWGRNFFIRLVTGASVERWKRIERAYVQQADRVITVVDEAKEHYVNDCETPSEKVTILMNTEDLDYFYSIPIGEEIVKKYQPYFTISYIGGFGPHRGIQTAISAMPLILQGIPNARLLLVGAGGNETELKELAKSKGIDEAVEFTGWQPFSLVPSYISSSKVCLIPHIASGHTNTTIPHKIFQCMAMGKPVIVSSAAPLERIVRETGAGLAYPSGDVQLLAQAVIKIYGDNGLATALGEAGKRAVKERYNWQREGEKLIALYQDLEKSSR